ncbi:MAG: YbhB/YbcL family Raf kinase inhibitor-like protein [Flavobacteriales bacterium]|nr:YbhB/YbcL family Raf kinase inhibitor-like protein [Flavobacteriales bacterium]MBK9539130.1 YbhB/YbcL family Raf kinase inhibitor-like protein [Flavobacteriales bacterium]
MAHPLFFALALVCATPAVIAQNGFTLTTDIGGQASMREVYNGFGCTGENRSPLLSWSGAPEGTQSYAVTMYDPDAPTGSGWWHWVAFDLPTTTMGLPAGAGTPGMPGMPSSAVQSRTDFGGFGYGGPCPPPGHGPHQYIITVYAVKTEKLGLDQNASPATVGYTLNSQTLAKASVVFYYGR